MDPALAELLLADDAAADPMIEAIIRLRRPGLSVPETTVITRFGTIATCRLRLSAARRVRDHPHTVSLKAARLLVAEHVLDELATPAPRDLPRPASPVRRPSTRWTGAGVVIGFVDWGFDVDHPNLKHPDGTTRLLGLWDQHARGGRNVPRPYGYGRVYGPAEINAALAHDDPYRRLGYRAARTDRGQGTHVTHVADIAAGNGSNGGPVGVAPQADLIFVELADQTGTGELTLGDSVRLLEAVDWIRTTAAGRPWVINLSLGRMGGPHDASLLTEMALDELLLEAPGRAVVQSAGNYHTARTHASGVLHAGEQRVLTFISRPGDPTTNELEIWYDGTDELSVRIDPPGASGPTVKLGETKVITHRGQQVGRVHHRRHDPNNGDHHVDAFLFPALEPGRWTVTLEAVRVTSGRFHAWLERDDACAPCQSRFVPGSVSQLCTTGTIANGRLPIVVGAYDPSVQTVWTGSSSGITRDGRDKPDVAAPGVRIEAARSAPVTARRSPGGLVRKTGTSMATPHVAGAVALCLQISAGRVTAQQLRTLVLGTADHPADGVRARLGRGVLDTPALIAATERAFPAARRQSHPTHADPTRPDLKDSIMDTDLDPTPEEMTGWLDPLALNPAGAYRELLYRPTGSVAAWLRERYEVIARPGAHGDDARDGDVLVRVVLGHPHAARCEVIGVDRVAIHRGRRLPAGALLLRPVAVSRRDDPGDEADLSDDLPNEDTGDWTGAPDQVTFRNQVLAEAIRRKGRPAQRNLERSELQLVPGTKIPTRPATAQAADQLVTAARSALQTAQAAGDEDAQRTVGLTVVSGYRDDSRQRRLWLSYFVGYYNRTREVREALATGPHSAEALDYLLRPRRRGGYGIGARIAPPGFSNHQSGIAVDLQQLRTNGHAIVNDSRAEFRARWRRTWFHHWLVQHAAEHGFRPLATEEWHWEHAPTQPSSTATPTASSAGTADEDRGGAGCGCRG